MTAYAISYTIRGKDNPHLYSISVDARDLKSAKKKIGRKHGYKTGRMIQVERVTVIGYC